MSARDRLLRAVLGVLAAACLLVPAPAQEPEGPPSGFGRGDRQGRPDRRFGPPPWERRGLPVEHAEREAIRRALMEAFDVALGAAHADGEARERFEAMARQLTRRLPLELLRELESLAAPDRVRRIVELWRAQRRESDERFLELLDEDTAAEVRALEGEAFHARVAELRAERILDRALASARSRGLVEAQEEARMRAAAPAEKVRFADELNKKVFLDVWREKLDPDQLERLRELAPERFFRDPAVRRYRLSGHLGDADLETLRALPEERRRGLLRALRGELGPDDEEALAPLAEATRAHLRGLEPEERRRLAHELEHVYFAERVRARLERWISEQLDPEERRRFAEADDEGKLRILAERAADPEWRREMERSFLDRMLRRRLGERRELLREDDPAAAIRAAFPEDEARPLLLLLERLQTLGGPRTGPDPEQDARPFRRGERPGPPGEGRRPRRDRGETPPSPAGGD